MEDRLVEGVKPRKAVPRGHVPVTGLRVPKE
jgi:hypothetical protein